MTLWRKSITDLTVNLTASLLVEGRRVVERRP